MINFFVHVKDMMSYPIYPKYLGNNFCKVDSGQLKMTMKSASIFDFLTSDSFLLSNFKVFIFSKYFFDQESTWSSE
jgi:hypothetical protein